MDIDHVIADATIREEKDEYASEDLQGRQFGMPAALGPPGRGCVMTTTTLEVHAQATVFAATLALAAHREFTHIVSSLDLGDRVRWAAADRLVAGVTTEANDVVTALTGERWLLAAPGVPPVVRVRELSAAQRRLEAALDRCAGSERFHELGAYLSGSANRVTESARQLGVVTRRGADRNGAIGRKPTLLWRRRNIGRPRAGR